MARRRTVKLLVTVVSLALLAASCGSGGPSSKLVGNYPSSFDPPKQVDPKKIAVPGLVLNTNSRTWHSLVDSADVVGAVVIYVQPSGPSDEKGIARGDVLTAVDGTKVTDHEQGIALLRSFPGQKRELSFVQRDGKKRTVTVEPKIPHVASVRQFVNVQIAGNPNDAVLRFIRAQSSGGKFQDDIADVNKAIQLKPQFVEAMTLRANLLWDRIGVDPKKTITLTNQALGGWKAALDLDPDNVVTLSVLSQALTRIGRTKLARADAEKALKLDSNHPYSYYALSLALTKAKNNKDALAPAWKAVDLNPYNVLYFRRLARAYANLEKKDDCTKTAEAMKAFLVQNNLQRDANALARMCR